MRLCTSTKLGPLRLKLMEDASAKQTARGDEISRAAEVLSGRGRGGRVSMGW